MRQLAVAILAALTVACSGAPGPAAVSSLAPSAAGTAPAPAQTGSPASCSPTPQGVPANYIPDAPVRSTIGGGGYAFAGTVRSAGSCAPVAGARVELWLVNPSGSYDADHRATVVADGSGRYTVNTSFPPAYGGGGSHIHIRVTADRHRPLVSIFFPTQATTSGGMDLVLEAN